MDDQQPDTLHKTPLCAVHEALGARMVPFAGYLMPVQYPTGIIAEHNHTREKCGLFDVSHMGQAWLKGPGFETVAGALEALVPADLGSLQPGRQRYSQLLNEQGGCIDDLMIARSAHPDMQNGLFLVVNASRKHIDFAHLRERLPAGIELEELPGLALLALQGPRAEAVLEVLLPGVAALEFMQGAPFTFEGEGIYATRSGYTGEDGYEISVPASKAEALWTALTAHDDVKPIGLGARDSLRLEAGLSLYGHELDETVSPVEASLLWSIPKHRREQGGFPGAARIQREIAEGPSRKIAGIKPEGRAPAREGTVIMADGEEVGVITSGGFGPTVGGPVALGFVPPALAKPGTKLDLMVRGKALPAEVVKLPFVQKSFKK
ncbi:MAG: glycine cleavage system aminomethyltransferase GcvT [Anderseniella sp.]|nr:glycine cleavage system aminomethyltransferase GcvT [Anderseniella sp.]